MSDSVTALVNELTHHYVMYLIGEAPEPDPLDYPELLPVEFILGITRAGAKVQAATS